VAAAGRRRFQKTAVKAGLAEMAELLWGGGAFKKLL
jgi:hypothetical protein